MTQNLASIGRTRAQSPKMSTTAVQAQRVGTVPFRTMDTRLRQAWNAHSDRPLDVERRFIKDLDLFTRDETIEPKLRDVARLIEHTFLGHVLSADPLLPWIEQLAGLKTTSGIGRTMSHRLDFAARVARGETPISKNLSEGDQLGACANGLITHCLAGSGATGFEWIDKFAAELPTAEEARVKAIAQTMSSLSSHIGFSKPASAAREVMVKAAMLSRDAWRMVGNWRDVDRAEYFIAIAYVVAGRGLEAIEHGERCKAICVENSAPAYELFFAAESIAKGAVVAGDPKRARGELADMRALFAGVKGAGSVAYCKRKLAETEAFFQDAGVSIRQARAVTSKKTSGK